MLDVDAKSYVCHDAHLLLAKIVWQIGDHDLRLAGNSVLWWTALLAWLLGLGLAGLASFEAFAILSSESLVGGGGEWGNLAWSVGWASTVGGRLRFAICLALNALYISERVTCYSSRSTYATTTTGRTASASPTTAAATSRVAALRLFLAGLSALGGWFGLAG